MSTHNIYVIELDKEILKKKKFREANPDHHPTDVVLPRG
jgi:hypothetical protein